MPRVQRSLEELEGAGDRSERARLEAEMMSTTGPCAPLIRMFGELAGRHADQRVDILNARVPQALRACECNVADLVLLEALLLWQFGGFQQPARWVRVRRGHARSIDKRKITAFLSSAAQLSRR